jgi:serine/threonine protein kinase/Tol biopolymer transport system component
MPLTPGTRIGPYEVLAPLGEGGMGEVYRARDAKLNRDVAVKILPDAFATDPDRVARFTREAQTLAALNHPNIAAIYGLEANALVMELVEGDDLSALIARGPLPLAEALPVARQIAEALEAAHEAGVIHRDLKPANIKVRPDGTVKVLDFGLAKAVDPTDASGSAVANSPTLTARATQMGMILGTAAYMAPEQARGKVVDRRADIWAFGVVLYEMLTGRRAFEGEDISVTLASVIRDDVRWEALPADLPAAIRRMLRRCLEKDPRRRLSAIGDARLELDEPGSTLPEAAPDSPPRRAVRLPMALALIAAAIVVTAAVTSLWPRNGPSPSQGVSRLSIVLPDGDELNPSDSGSIAIAPDGSMIVYGGLRNGTLQLYVREMGATEPRALPGTDGAESPFFKPDGRWIGFFAAGKLKKMTVAGTALQDLADAPGPRGGAWSADDTIYFAPGNITGLRKVAAAGGPDSEVTTLDRSRGEISHRWPTVSADGRTLLFSVWTGPGFDEHWIDRLTLADGKRQMLARNVNGPALAVGGFLVNGGRMGGLQALPWPAADSTGVEPIQVPLAVRDASEGASTFAVSPGGTFAYVPAGSTSARVVWIDRGGARTQVSLPERRFAAAAISPDGLHAALQVSSGVEEIWLYDFATQTLTPIVTTGGSSQAPVWSADGKYVYYRGTRSGFRNLFRKAIDGASGEERLTTKPDVSQTPYSITPDGKWLVYGELGKGVSGDGDLWKLPLDSDAAPSPIIATPAAEKAARVSPDGRWIAYVSDVSGRDEVWVQSFAEGGARRQISREGGVSPLWSRDGKELIFTGPDALMTVAVAGDTFGVPRERAAGRFVGAQNSNTNYDIARDGRVLELVPSQPAKAITRIEIVLNGLELLQSAARTVR